MQALSISMDNDELIISDHAYKRIRQRNGWNRKTANRMIKRIYINGLRYDELKGYKKMWICYRMHNGCKEDEYVIYGDYVYIFKKHVLKTTYPLPSKENVLKHLKN